MLTRTKPRWVVDPTALFTMLKLGEIRDGDYLAFRTLMPTEKHKHTMRLMPNVQARHDITIECIDADDAEYVLHVYANDKLSRSDDATPQWFLIGWRRG